MEDKKVKNDDILSGARRLMAVVSIIAGTLNNEKNCAALKRIGSAFYSHALLLGKHTHPSAEKEIAKSLSELRSTLSTTAKQLKAAGIEHDMVIDLYEKLAARMRQAVDLSEENKTEFILQPAAEIKMVNIESSISNFDGCGTLERNENKAMAVTEYRPLSDRQQSIISFAKEKKVFKLRDLDCVFPALSEKTIRNDLVALCDHGFIERKGTPPQSHYRIVEHAVNVLWDAVPECDVLATRNA